MPIYEFRCKSCKSKSSIFVKSIGSSYVASCAHCGGQDLERLLSSFAYRKSMQSLHAESGEPSMFPNDDYYKDPRNIGRWAERRLEEMGVEMPDEAREMIDAAREGEMPGPVKDL